MFDIFEVQAPRRPAWRWGAYRDTGLFVCLSYERERAASRPPSSRVANTLASVLKDTSIQPARQSCWRLRETIIWDANRRNQSDFDCCGRYGRPACKGVQRRRQAPSLGALTAILARARAQRAHAMRANARCRARAECVANVRAPSPRKTTKN